MTTGWIDSTHENPKPHVRAALRAQPESRSSAELQTVSVAARLHDLAGDPRLAQPGAEPLQTYLHTLRGAFRRIDAPAESGGLSVAEVDSRCRLLERMDESLGGASRQLATLESFRREAVLLRGLVVRLPEEFAPQYHMLDRLAYTILEQAMASRTLVDLLPSAEFLKGGHDVEFVAHEQGRLLVDAVVTGRLAAWLTKASGWQQPKSRQAVVAALLLDVGSLMFPASRYAEPDLLEDRTREVYLMHPQISAAMVGHIRRAPAALTRRIAQHHERLDGSGFPHGLPASQLDHVSRLLAVVAETTRLLRDHASHSRSLADSPGVLRAAVGKLYEQATQGKLDRDWVDMLATSLNPADADVSETETGSAELSDGRPASHRLHRRHDETTAPHRSAMRQLELPFDIEEHQASGHSRVLS